MQHDTIADLFTRLRNALRVNKRAVTVCNSRMNRSLLQIMVDQGYIKSFNPLGYEIEVSLKYFQGKGVIEKIQRLSKPSLRVYAPARELPRIRNGFGIAFISSSKGIMTDAQARAQGLGGEVIGYVY